MCARGRYRPLGWCGLAKVAGVWQWGRLGWWRGWQLGRRRSNKFWIVLKTKQASSRDALDNVRQQTFEYFHPLYRSRSVNGVRKPTALFPYYLLVRVNEALQDWRVLSSTRGVSSVLMNGKLPSIVRNGVVDDLRVLTDDTADGYYHDPAHEPPRFNPGESVCGLRGLFQDKFGTYRGLAGNRGDRVRVLFSFLGREAEFELRADDLVAVAA